MKNERIDAKKEDKNTTIKKVKRSIPTFETIEAESDFWDEQDLTEFFEGEEIPIEASDTMRGVVWLRFSEKILSQIRQLAKQRGVGYQSLMQTWIVERLKEKNSENSENSAKSSKS